jgi:regulator of sirC expression with transglutaminase-like and TPR domain
MDDYSDAIRLSPEDPRPWNNRGWVRERLGDLAGAVADYTAALAAAPPGGAERPVIEQNLAAAQARLAAR